MATVTPSSNSKITFKAPPSDPTFSDLGNQLLRSAEKAYDTVRKKYIGIQECLCGDFDRRSVTARSDLEKALVDEIVKTFPNKNEKIKLCSVGSGGCFQEAVILCKLIKEGYTNIELVLVDQSYAAYSNIFIPGTCGGALLSVARLKEFVKEELHAEQKVTIKTEEGVEKYMETITSPETAPHAVILTDLQSTEMKEKDEFNQTWTSDLLSVSLKLMKKNPHFSGKTLCAFTKTCNNAGIAACVSLENQSKAEEKIKSYRGALSIVTNEILTPPIQKIRIIPITMNKKDESRTDQN
ncbi:MAG: hypothetical protein JSS60_04180 [Verrucomicrobia bacterium]|nr:hypothetical protein [Verrucomicrobiota bacterium]